MYERLKVEIGKIHEIPPENVDIFSLRDAGSDVDVRYNCHSSPYYTSARLNGLMLSHLTQVNDHQLIPFASGGHILERLLCCSYN